MKRAIVLSVLGSALIASAPVAIAAKGHLNDCIQTALNGEKRTRQLDIHGHTFYCYPVEVQKVGKRLHVEGKLVHEKFGRDDKINYEFFIEGGKVVPKSMKKEVVRGYGIPDALVTVADAAGLPSGLAEEAKNEAERRVYKKWQAVANKIIDLIADEVAEQKAH